MLNENSILLFIFSFEGLCPSFFFKIKVNYMKKIIDDKIILENLNKINLKSSYNTDLLTKQMMYAYSKSKQFNATNIINKYINNNKDIFLENEEIQVFANFDKENSYNIKFTNEEELKEELKIFLDKYRSGKLLHKDVIEEGIKFFKTSDKIDKVINKLVKKVDRLPQDSEDKKPLKELLAKMDKISNEFRKLENDYALGIDKNVAKVKYKKLLNDYIDMLKIISKDRTKDALKVINSTVSTMLALVLPYTLLGKFFPGLLSLSGNFLNMLKRSGALIALGIPTKLLTRSSASAIDKISNERILHTEIEKALKNKEHLLL